MEEKRLITAALPYVNNIPHLGHIVGSHLPADIFARYCRLKGYDTSFIGGTDEHGTPVELAAEELGIDISTLRDELTKKHKKIYDWFNISYDNFSRTSRKIHHKTTQGFFKKIHDNGYISQGRLSLLYCKNDDRFLPDRYVEGTCPNCSYEFASGDQCEACTSLLDVGELLDPKCKICGEEPVLRESEHLFLQLDKLSDRLEKWLYGKTEWRPQVRSLALGWIKRGLKERCITRDLKNGVKVPLKGFEDKVLYVWFDAPIGYISATKEKYPSRWEEFWKDKDTKIYHFLGKDNIPFHTIFWPGMLIAHGEFNLPYQVVGLQYLNYEGEKFSKSRKRGIFCEKLLETDIDSDIMRAYLTFLIPETKDSEFTWDNFQNVVNSEIIDNYGNFINRTLSFIYNKLGGFVEKSQKCEFVDPDKRLIETTKNKVAKIEGHLEKVELRKAFFETLSLSTAGNKYFNETEPWNLIKNNFERAKATLYLSANLSRTLAILTEPFLPNTAQRVWDYLNLDGKVNEPGIWDSVGAVNFPTPHSINKPSVLFEKITAESVENLKKILSD